MRTPDDILVDFHAGLITRGEAVTALAQRITANNVAAVMSMLPPDFCEDLTRWADEWSVEDRLVLSGNLRDDEAREITRDLDVARAAIEEWRARLVVQKAGCHLAYVKIEPEAPAGIVFIADSGNNQVRDVNRATGAIITVASGANPDDAGSATAAELNNPTGIVVDLAGDLVIADSGNNVVREVGLSTGVIKTVAGVGGCSRYGGDNGPAAATELNNPTGLGADSAANLFIADPNTTRIDLAGAAPTRETMSPAQ